MSDREEFLAWVNSDLRSAEMALHDGDAEPRRAIWSRREPVTIFGALKNATGRAEVDQLFTELEARFSESVSYEFEIVAAEVIGDAAYTVGFEHSVTLVNGTRRRYTLRATQIYRRSGATWTVVHRHGDTVEDVEE
jgi:ketosteroid isomerase-like protein